MIHLVIDGKKIKAKEGSTILQTARENGIDIPTLCYHDALEPSGMCRLCTVEVTAGKRKKFVTACNYPVKEGIEVKTASEEILQIRKMIVELLLARCPEVKKLQELAKTYGVEKPRFPREEQDCILCGLCVRVCQEVIGANAISLVNRGIDAKVDTPFHLSSELCIGCGACSAVCPTAAIQLEYTKDKLKITPFNTLVELKKCQSCGKVLAPEPFVSFVRRKLGHLNELALLCQNCKKEKESLALANPVRIASR